MSLGIESLKKWVDYWRKFKGKKVRIWFVRIDRSPHSQDTCIVTDATMRGMRMNGFGIIGVNTPDKLRMLLGVTCVDGNIADVVDSPFGIMLSDVKFWKLVASKSKGKRNFVATEENCEIEKVFVPMFEIARIDFLAQ